MQNGKAQLLTVRRLKEILSTLSDDMEVYVACEGYSNWNFKENRQWPDQETVYKVMDGKLFICDGCAYDG